MRQLITYFLEIAVSASPVSLAATPLGIVEGNPHGPTMRRGRAALLSPQSAVQCLPGGYVTDGTDLETDSDEPLRVPASGESEAFSVPELDSVLIGPFWSGPVRVLRGTATDSSIRLEAVGVMDGKYYDRTLTLEQFRTLVHRQTGTAFTFDADGHLFRLTTEALRIQLAHAFDPQFAVSVSQVDPLPHQLDAVYKHMLALPRIRFCLADDPGAGKTIMAGLLMRELIQQRRVNRVLILCPKALTDQWRREMWERFRERFTLLTGDTIAGAFGQNAWTDNDRIICSLDLAVQDHILPGLEQASWDLTIIDEAHRLSAYRFGLSAKVDKSKRYQLGEKLAKSSRNLLLMTATPHKGDDENFRLLLSLLDDKVFASRAGMQRALHTDNSPYFLRRMKEAMHHFDGRPLFLPRRVDTVRYPLEPHEQELYDAVTHYVAHGLAQAESTRNRTAGLALTVLQRRLASSLYAITRSLERRRERLSEELDKSRSTGHVATSNLAIRDEDDDDDLGETSDEEEDTLSAASTARTTEELRQEIHELDSLVEMARRARNRGPERKLDEFLKVIHSPTVRDLNEKVLVFTEHRDTLSYVSEQIRREGYSVCTIHGGMKLQDRIAAEKDFRGSTQFMVATDAAGEGINLQFCRVMVNWDLPWNPNRLEQRMGRIHRYGQEYEVEIVNLVAETTREGAVLIRLLDKLQRMRQALGYDQVYDVISGVLGTGQVRLDALIREAILHRRSMGDILADFDFIESDASLAAARATLGEALATAHIDMTFINEGIRESKERRLTPEYVEKFFVDALRQLGGRITRGTDQEWRLEFLPADIRRTVRAANVGEFGTENRVITFVKERVKRDPPVEFIAPDHPLFDVIVSRTLDRGRDALGQGAVMVDRETHAPYLLWLLETAVVNGEGSTVHKRLLALRQDGAEYKVVAPGAILDLAPVEGPTPVPRVLQPYVDQAGAVRAASELYAQEYLAEVTAEQERRVAIVARALQQSVDDNLTELQTKLERQQEDAAKGKDMSLAIRNTNEQIDELTGNLRQRQAELARQRVTSIETPRVLGAVAVVPALRPVAALPMGGDHSAVDKAAMKFVMEFEERAGRHPEDVSKTGVGCDIKSTAPDGSVRYIEVKGHTLSGDVLLYYTEWQTANRMRDEFFIYIVNEALADKPTLWIVRDPVGRGIKPTEKIVEYHVPEEELLAVAELASTH